MAEKLDTHVAEQPITEAPSAELERSELIERLRAAAAAGNLEAIDTILYAGDKRFYAQEN